MLILQKIYINYNDMKILYDMIYNPQYYKELLLGAEQLVEYYLMKKVLEGDK